MQEHNTMSPARSRPPRLSVLQFVIGSKASHHLLRQFDAKSKPNVPRHALTTCTSLLMARDDRKISWRAHMEVLHSSHVAWQEHWKCFALERTFFPIGKGIYFSCHAAWLPCKTSIAAVYGTCTCICVEPSLVYFDWSLSPSRTLRDEPTERLRTKLPVYVSLLWIFIDKFRWLPMSLLWFWFCKIQMKTSLVNKVSFIFTPI